MFNLDVTIMIIIPSLSFSIIFQSNYFWVKVKKSMFLFPPTKNPPHNFNAKNKQTKNIHLSTFPIQTRFLKFEMEFIL